MHPTGNCFISAGNLEGPELNKNTPSLLEAQKLEEMFQPPKVISEAELITILLKVHWAITVSSDEP